MIKIEIKRGKANRMYRFISLIIQRAAEFFFSRSTKNYILDDLMVR